MKSHPSTALALCIQYANRTRKKFAVVENSAGSCCLKM